MRLVTIDLDKLITTLAKTAEDGYTYQHLGTLKGFILGCEVDPWVPLDEDKPEPHEDVLVRGVEMFSGKEVVAVKVLDGDVFRPVSAPSVVWKEWRKIPK